MKASLQGSILRSYEVTKNYYRLRVGKLRILFEMRPERTIIIYAILPRNLAYQK